MSTTDSAGSEPQETSGHGSQTLTMGTSEVTDNKTLEAPRSRRRGILRFSLVILLLVLAATTTGFFVRFSQMVASTSLPDNPRADAIVVMTGGTERVAQAVKLLEGDWAGRLLISGVHPGTTIKQIASMTGTDTALFECCIDLDRLALNTEGNATETAAWVDQHGFDTLLLVTSAYHLPRASMELKSALPNVQLVPYPVYSAGLDLKGWYKDPATIRLLFREYVKYTLASFRIVAKRFANSLGI